MADFTNDDPNGYRRLRRLLAHEGCNTLETMDIEVDEASFPGAQTIVRTLKLTKFITAQADIASYNMLLLQPMKSVEDDQEDAELKTLLDTIWKVKMDWLHYFATRFQKSGKANAYHFSEAGFQTISD